MKNDEEFRKDAQWLARQIFTAETMIQQHQKAIAKHRQNIKRWKTQLIALGMFGLESTMQIDYTKSPSHDVEGLVTEKEEPHEESR